MEKVEGEEEKTSFLKSSFKIKCCIIDIDVAFDIRHLIFEAAKHYISVCFHKLVPKEMISLIYQSTSLESSLSQILKNMSTEITEEEIRLHIMKIREEIYKYGGTIKPKLDCANLISHLKDQDILIIFVDSCFHDPEIMKHITFFQSNTFLYILFLENWESVFSDIEIYTAENAVLKLKEQSFDLEAKSNVLAFSENSPLNIFSEFEEIKEFCNYYSTKINEK